MASPRKLGIAKQTVRAVVLFAGTLLITTTGHSYCFIGYHGYYREFSNKGTVAQGCGLLEEYFASGFCDGSMGIDCNNACMDHPKEVEDRIKSYMLSVDSNGQPACVELDTWRHKKTINAPLNDGVCTNKEGCE